MSRVAILTKEIVADKHQDSDNHKFMFHLLNNVDKQLLNSFVSELENLN